MSDGKDNEADTAAVILTGSDSKEEAEMKIKKYIEEEKQ